MAQNRSYDPPITTPPDTPPRTIKQVDTQTQSSEWGAIPRVVPRIDSGIPLQRSITGRSEGSER